MSHTKPSKRRPQIEQRLRMFSIIFLHKVIQEDQGTELNNELERTA